MNFEFTKSWCMNMARQEGDLEISAGTVPVQANQPQTTSAQFLSELHIAFGKFVRLMRKRKGLRLEDLAKVTNIDLEELISIELNPQHSPEPRAVYNLALKFEIPHKAMVQLSGLAQVRDQAFTEEAVRFAARSEPLEGLKPEEEEALMHFVTVLSTRK